MRGEGTVREAKSSAHSMVMARLDPSKAGWLAGWSLALVRSFMKSTFLTM
jgi:hypothetical protein